MRVGISVASNETKNKIRSSDENTIIRRKQRAESKVMYTRCRVSGSC